ncbi:MFS transporter [Peribacillus huizhouensis]|uniref:GPH family glycoside/pentoside/hexuronide:cation symporter n=1 Tax=Peribacillus huizhouensis TaxID=1501239 RepID=A0ABR6CRA9_9BACI|nr:glycoside-pentoside-hexuronide (GPH):cation symporter [Peribacillus huizhouensis]MBA9027178.1 GPH family glycoside/pentoside/hexuronide:cation symporter [Peribacillus huizhouensis]
MSQSISKKEINTESIHSNGTVRAFGLRDKLGYMFGDFGNDFFFILVSSFLMVYYTDVYGLSAAFVGILFLIARLWDAVADVTWGRFIDTRTPSKHGKFKPWIFRMSFPLVISGVLMFVHIPGMSNGFYEAYAFVTYILWGTLYSTVNIPYGSMASLITDDPIERTSLSTFRTMGAMSASLIINAVGPLIVFVDNKADADGFLMAAVIFGVLSFACYMACYKLSTERVAMPENNGIKPNLGHTLKALLKNKPLIAILGASLIFMMSTMLIGAVNVYLFKEYFSNTAALSIVGIIQTVTVFIAIPLVKPLVAKFGKKEITTVGMILAAAVYILLFFLPNLSISQFIAVSAIGMFGYAFFNTMIWAFVTDVIDYHELLTGIREDGTVYSFYSFARKIGQALAGGIGGFAITAIGYDATREVQSQNALDGIYALATIVPGAIYLIIFFIIVFFYPLNKQRMNQLKIDLAEKRKNKK